MLDIHSWDAYYQLGRTGIALHQWELAVQALENAATAIALGHFFRDRVPGIPFHEH